MSTVALAQDLGIVFTSELKQDLSAHLAQAGELRVDASQVGRVHTAAIQVLCAFVLARRQAGTDTVFDNPTATFRDAARLLGLAPQLGLANDNEHNTQQVENAA